ncbi:class I SAM-dependent methyltransferase [Shewanella sp. NIFS-20-20]|uniref:class I SAM-dependent methyltransferase n=1 Tax=Shewanella sp. NIFS-20-20 TaxID=2853806 RepID=UPI001C48A5D7|nr:methyltransferase domain-containing protein [Shewanella sp. NIFS-20-20]MBV7314324.1 class I SAM-dependent methyltransferase [Shewanella sp. NIFS-20-20]
MKLNEFEKRLVAHPIRRWFQSKVELPILVSLFKGSPSPTPMVLEIGCGFGHGIPLILEHFKPMQLTAVDIDGDMVEACRQQWQHHPNVMISQADAEQLGFQDNQFDLACNFAVFHHIPQWQKALAQVYRVLRPGGYFLMEDLYRAAICNPLSKRLFDHPQTNRFDHQSLLDELQSCGFEIVNQAHILNLSGMILAQKPRHYLS